MHRYWYAKLPWPKMRQNRTRLPKWGWLKLSGNSINEGDKVIIAGDEKIIDMSFMNNTRNFNNRPFQYETNLFDDWLQKTVAPKL